jgi:hypothetical protein
MTHSEFIYQEIPQELRTQLIENFYVLVTNLVEDATFQLVGEERSKLFTALGDATNDGDYQSMFEAFGMVVTSYFDAKRKANEEWLVDL